MASRTIVLYEDDLDGTKAAGTVTFALEGVQYEIDLSSKNADKLRKAMAPYVEAG
jgi:Lsr2